MKIILKILLFLILFTITNCKQKKKSTDDKIELNLKFPEIGNWIECYSNPKVKNRFDEQINNGTKLCGVYLNKNTLNQIKINADYEFDDYATFFTRKNQILTENQNDLKNIFFKSLKKWPTKTKNRKEAVELAKNEGYLETDTPVFLEGYEFSDKVYSAVMLTKPFENNDFVSIMILNLINTKNILIYSGYFLNLNDDNSIDVAKENNRKMILEFIKNN